MMGFSIILACTLEGGIGYNNGIPWHIKEDMMLFKKITEETSCYFKQNAIIMGRKTWESLPIKPLPNRINIIISRSAHEKGGGERGSESSSVIFVNSLENALYECEKSVTIDKIFVIGGKSLYDLCLNNDKYSRWINDIHLSVLKKKYECDTHVNLKEIIRKYKNYNIHDINFHKDFIYVKFINKNCY